MKVIINRYSMPNPDADAVGKLELGITITTDDIMTICPKLAKWQAQSILGRFARTHDTGVFYEAAVRQIEEWGHDQFPYAGEFGEDSETPETPE